MLRKFKIIYSTKQHGWDRDKFWNNCRFYKHSIILIKSNYDTILGGYSAVKWENFGDAAWGAASAPKHNFLFTFF